MIIKFELCLYMVLVSTV